jgi:hypothetical protein
VGLHQRRLPEFANITFPGMKCSQNTESVPTFP